MCDTQCVCAYAVLIKLNYVVFMSQLLNFIKCNTFTFFCFFCELHRILRKVELTGS